MKKCSHCNGSIGLALYLHDNKRFCKKSCRDDYTAAHPSRRHLLVSSIKEWLLSWTQSSRRNASTTGVSRR